MVFFTVLLYGLYKNGLQILQAVRAIGHSDLHPAAGRWSIEIISFLSRPVSHSVRLFANMLAGHITLKVFAGFVTSL